MGGARKAQLSDSRRLLGGVQVQASTSVRSRCYTQNAVYQRFIYLYDIAAGPHKAFLKENLFSSSPKFVLEVTRYPFF